MASVREQAAWAEAAVDILEKRVGQLESDLGALRQSQQDIARHLEEAVGPAGEGAHRQHWWSRRH
jgi:hypothetical protein